MTAEKIPRGAIALMGGTFDPVHRGHLESALAAKESFHLEGLVLVPARRSPHKSTESQASDQDRLALLRAAVGSDPRFAVWDFELTHPPPSYTIDTIKAYRSLWLRAYPGQVRPDLAWILGDDQLAQLHTWKDAERLFQSVWPIVVQRGSAQQLQHDLVTLEGRFSAQVIARLRAGLVPLIEPHPASATEIRRRIAAREDTQRWLLPEVEREIHARGLYSTR